MLQTKFNFPSVYNPANQTKDELISNFVIRTREFEELFGTIKSDKMEKPPQHYIIQGQRGYGKTTLLLRLKYEIKRDKRLNTWLIPVMPGEEQYNIRNLEKLWQEIIEIIESEDNSFAGMSEQVEELYESDECEIEIFNLLINSLNKANKKIIILLDNFGDLLEKFSKKENHRLREIFITCNQIKLIGASSKILEFYYDYKHPFFDFFKVVTLEELQRKETLIFLRKLGENYKSDEINQVIEKQPGRIEALRRITGGIPRTIVLLFQIFIDDVKGKAINDLEFVLDQVTPLYKQRLDNLTPPQQAIVDAVAQNWDAISTKEIAKVVKMPSKIISAQLNLLEKNQLIKKIPTSTKNQLYQISERFFNIYYLMRLGRKKNRNKVIWLVRFFEIMCGEMELISRTEKHIKAIKNGIVTDKHAFYISQALAKTQIPVELQHELITNTKKYLVQKKSNYIKELDKSHLEIIEEVKTDISNGKYDFAKRKLKEDRVKEEYIPYIIANTLHSIKGNTYDVIHFLEEAAKKGLPEAIFNLAVVYESDLNDFKKAKQYYLMAIDYEDKMAMNNLAILYETEFNDKKLAEKYYLMAVDNGNNKAINNLAKLYFDLRKSKIKALEIQRNAIKKIKNEITIYTFLLILLWNDEIEEAIYILNDFINNYLQKNDITEELVFIFEMFLAKKQYNFTYNLFNDNKYDFKEKYKPLYYANLQLLGEKHKDEYLRMPPEIAETVEELLSDIEQLAIDYA